MGTFVDRTLYIIGIERMRYKVPLRMSRHQIPAVIEMARSGLKTSFARTKAGNANVEPLLIEQKPIAADLLQAYCRWSGCDIQSHYLPPHLFSYWALPALSNLVGQSPINIVRLLNQGVHLCVVKPIPTGARFHVHASMEGIEENDQRIRMHARVVASMEGEGECMVINNYTVVPKGSRNKSKSIRAKSDVGLEKVAQWSAAKNDGLNFALLTGDFNPIHTSSLFARLSGFRGCVLQGFAQLALTMEELAARFVIGELDVRFTKPMVLPICNVSVYVGMEVDEGWRSLSLQSADGDIYMVGRFR